MSFERAFRLGGSLGVVSGILYILSALVLLISVFIPVIPSLVFGTFILIANILIVFTLIAIIGIQIEQANTSSIVGFALSVAGLMLELAKFFSPSGSVLFVIGILLFAIGNMHTRKLPVAGMWLWFCGAIIALPIVYFGWRLLICLGLVISGVARLWIGSALSSEIVIDTD